MSTYSNRYEVGVVRQEVGVARQEVGVVVMLGDFNFTICFHLTQVFQDGCQTTIVPTQYVPPPQQYVVQQPLLQVWVALNTPLAALHLVISFYYLFCLLS